MEDINVSLTPAERGDRDRVQAEIEKRVAGAKVEKTEGLSPDLLNKTDILGE